MNLRFGLTETTIQKISGVFTRYPQVEKAVLYGSRAKGNYKNGSDIDLVLFGGEDLKTDTLCRIMNEIDDLLLPYTFDLATFRQIRDPDLIEHIRRAGVVFYRKAAKPAQV